VSGRGGGGGQDGGACCCTLWRLTVTPSPPDRPFPRSDNNECELGGGAKCDPDADCTDSQGTYTCTCKKGFEDVSDNKDGTDCIGGSLAFGPLLAGS
jgi:hypothetical protein